MAGRLAACLQAERFYRLSPALPSSGLAPIGPTPMVRADPRKARHTGRKEFSHGSRRTNHSQHHGGRRLILALGSAALAGPITDKAAEAEAAVGNGDYLGGLAAAEIAAQVWDATPGILFLETPAGDRTRRRIWPL